jgi:hypothetical protein
MARLVTDSTIISRVFEDSMEVVGPAQAGELAGTFGTPEPK